MQACLQGTVSPSPRSLPAADRRPPMGPALLPSSSLHQLPPGARQVASASGQQGPPGQQKQQRQQQQQACQQLQTPYQGPSIYSQARRPAVPRGLQQVGPPAKLAASRLLLLLAEPFLSEQLSAAALHSELARCRQSQPCAQHAEHMLKDALQPGGA